MFCIILFQQWTEIVKDLSILEVSKTLSFLILHFLKEIFIIVHKIDKISITMQWQKATEKWVDLSYYANSNL